MRKQLKVVLCFSPVGSTLRIRGRKFPAVTNCTSIDWFHEVKNGNKTERKRKRKRERERERERVRMKE